MYVLSSGGGCFFPVQPPACYGNVLLEEEVMLPSLELIQKEKNRFGDMVYTIRDQRGITSTVYEGELEVFLKERGVSVLKEGTPTMYPIPSKK